MRLLLFLLWRRATAAGALRHIVVIASNTNHGLGMRHNDDDPLGSV